MRPSCRTKVDGPQNPRSGVILVSAAGKTAFLEGGLCELYQFRFMRMTTLLRTVAVEVA
jgi:hypothetical protein